MKPVTQNISLPKLEENILKLWREKDIFNRSKAADLPSSLEQKEKSVRKSYVFYDGPPFATGLPHYGHLLAGTIKDVVGRFFTLKGYQVERRFGWDCHGLPVEVEIQKKLDLAGAKEIKDYGIDKFNEECRKIVLRYTKEWREFVERAGRWVDMDNEYKTMDLDFMESVWWVLKSLWERGLIYEGLKNVPYSWAISTPLSNFEANLNYKTVQDPAITVRFEIKKETSKKIDFNSLSDLPVRLYSWTTTPWTLPSNLALAVNSDISYSIIENTEDEELAVVATNLKESFFKDIGQEDAKSKVIKEVKGVELEGIEYEPLLPYFSEERERNAFRVYTADFVTAEEGTGIVHCASFGEEDLEVFKKHDIKVIDPLDQDGNFTEAVSDFSGVNIKKADPDIIKLLKSQNKVVSHTTIEHSYPFCWRTDTPLIYRSISSWFVNVEAIKDLLIQNNSSIHWVPGHLKDGRFGKWLEGARDWAISRNRFWGTPIPIWKCEDCDHLECIGSVDELEDKGGKKVSDLHSHFIDKIQLNCEKCSSKMNRIPDVLDCWFESGSMPYAQSHYPFENKEEFEENFPADFIAEGLDQTRGWFYTLLVLSSALFGRPAFKNVIVNGIVLAEDGKKMSKSLKNYPPPDDVMNEFGADALRVYLLSSAATRGEELRFSKAGVKDVIRQTLLPLWNAYNFFVTYAIVDEWTPDKIQDEKSTNLLDKWILSKVASLVERVDAALSSYHLYAAVPPVLDFVDQLTNWYIRLNRRRFWVGNNPEEKEDKFHAYQTLHTALLTFTRVLAPIAPFISEEIFLNLSRGLKDLEQDSVHLIPYPTLSEFEGLTIDESLENSMDLFEDVILLARGLRNDHGLKIRQPLSELTIIYPKEKTLAEIEVLEEYITDELNVKRVTYSIDEEEFVDFKAKLNTKLLGKTLGPKLGSSGMKELRSLVENLGSSEIIDIERGGALKFKDLELNSNDIIIERVTKPGIDATASSGNISIVLDTTLTPELRLEGLAREFVNRVQKLRKDSGFDVADRIALKYMTACNRIQIALTEHKDYVMKETLAVELSASTEKDFSEQNLSDAQVIDGESIIIGLERLS